MAENKTKAKNTNSKSTAKRNTTKKSNGVSNSSKSKNEELQRIAEEKRSRNQKFAIILFASSILIFLLIAISGESVWNWVHNVILGLFGVCSIAWPILLIYISVYIAIEKPVRSIKGKLFQIVMIVFLISSLIFLFQDSVDSTQTLGHQLGTLYNYGVNNIGAGFFSGILGIPFKALLGRTGGIIVVILALFVFLMIFTGTTLVQLFKSFARPVNKIQKSVSQSHERRRIEENRRRENSEIFDYAPLLKKDINSNKTKDNKSSELFSTQPKITDNIIDLNEDDAFKKFTDVVKDDWDFSEKPENNYKSIEDNYESDMSPVTEIPPHTKIDVPQKQPNPESVPIYIDTYDEKENLQPEYIFPSINLLKKGNNSKSLESQKELKITEKSLIETLDSFGVKASVIGHSRGPSVTRYELQPAKGVKISKITNLADDIALNLAASGVRIEAPIPGKPAVGIEVPNKIKQMVTMREAIESPAFNSAKSKLTVCLGRDIAGEVAITDLSKMPHLLIAGTTGSGKSICINSLIISILYKATPDEVRFLMIDPKMVELVAFNGIPHLLVPTVTDPRKASGALNWAVNEMETRYKLFSEYHVRDIHGFNRMVELKQKEMEEKQDINEEEPDLTDNLKKMPQIVIIIDEFADLMMTAPNEVEEAVCRLAQKARAAGMHMVIATQRPTVNVITGLIKANVPSRISLYVSSQTDSRTIIDTGGAEKLLGNGDMLFSPVGMQKPIRIQGCFISDEEREAVIQAVKGDKTSEYDEEVIDEIERQALLEKGPNSFEDESEDNADPMLSEAIKLVVEAGQASTSQLQRRLRLGYARAGRLIDEMEQRGIVGPHEGSKPRQVLITKTQWLEMSIND